MCAPDAPTAPDPKEQYAAQTNANTSTAIANAAMGNINEYTPQGSVERKQTGTKQVWDENLGKNIEVPTYSAYQTYSPQEQAIYESGAANRLGVNSLAGTLIDQVGNTVNQGINYGALPKAGSTKNIKVPKYTQFQGGPQLDTQLAGADNFSADRQKYEDALMQRMNPQLKQERDILNQQALNQGLMPGSEAYNRMIDTATRQENDARYGAILAGGEEQQRMFGMDLAASNFSNNALQQMFGNQFQVTGANNQLQDQTFNAQSNLFGLQNTEHQNALKEAYDKYTLPINTIGALMSGGQVQSPQYAGANMPQLANVDYSGLMQKNYDNQMGAYEQEMSAYNNLVGGAGSLFGSIISKSDIRSKKNIVHVGEVDGHNIYEFDYIDPADGAGRSVGVMAQEVLQTRPEAVLQRADGMLMVNYSILFEGKL